MVWVTLVRHGETADTRRGIYSGWRDPSLTPLGRQQAALVVPGLIRAKLDYQLVVSSDLLRARETAAVVAAAMGLPLELDCRLRELDMGEWSGQDYAGVMASGPARARAWYANPDQVTPPGGETLTSLRQRASACLLWWAQEALSHGRGQPSSALVAVSHAGAIRAVVQAWSARPFWEIDVPPGWPLTLEVPLQQSNSVNLSG